MVVFVIKCVKISACGPFYDLLKSRIIYFFGQRSRFSAFSWSFGGEIRANVTFWAVLRPIIESKCLLFRETMSFLDALMVIWRWNASKFHFLGRFTTYYTGTFWTFLADCAFYYIILASFLTKIDKLSVLTSFTTVYRRRIWICSNVHFVSRRNTRHFLSKNRLRSIGYLTNIFANQFL